MQEASEGNQEGRTSLAGLIKGGKSQVLKDEPMCPRDKDEGWRENVFQSAWGRAGQKRMVLRQVGWTAGRNERRNRSSYLTAQEAAEDF